MPTRPRPAKASCRAWAPSVAATIPPTTGPTVAAPNKPMFVMAALRGTLAEPNRVRRGGRAMTRRSPVASPSQVRPTMKDPTDDEKAQTRQPATKRASQMGKRSRSRNREMRPAASTAPKA